MTPPLKGVIWLTSPESQQRDFLDATTDAERLSLGFISFRGNDMTSNGWVRVGTVEVTPTFDSREDLTRSAVEAVDTQIKLAEAEFRVKLNKLREYRSTLICLEAPK